MISVILAVVFALGVGYIATQNAMQVSIQLGSNLYTGIPLYFVIVGSLLAGLLIGWLFNLAGALGSTFALRGKDSRLKAVNNSNESLQKRVHELEVENAKLHTTIDPEYVHPAIREEDVHPGRRSFVESVKASFRPKAY